MSERRSPQEIFDVAYKGLASQGFRQSRSSNIGGCAYRGENGLKCAVGHLIDDANYSEGLEGLAANDSSVLHAARLSNYHADLLEDIQDAHDGDDFLSSVKPEWMKARLSDVAAKHGLQVPEVSA